MQRTTAGGSAGGRWPVRRAASAIRAGMSPGGRNTGSSGSTTTCSGGIRAASSSSLGQVSRLPGRRPGADRLLEQPQAHHVAQVPDRAVHPGLVGEVGRPARLGEDRLVQLDTHQGPGAAGDVREVAGPGRARRRRRRRCRASPPRSPAAGPRAARPHSPATSRQEGPRWPRPGWRSGGKSPRGRPARPISAAWPSPAPAMSSSCSGGRVGQLGPDLAGQPVGEQVGDQQQRRGAAGSCGVAPARRRAGRSC